MSTPLVTIGMPVYNGSRFIRYAIDSVLKQTYTNFELIITDDGSTDDTVEIVKQYKDNRIQLISDSQNKGISYRLNQLIDLAKGLYFMRMDADDLMFPNRVEKQVCFLQSHSHVDVVGSKAVIIDDNHHIIGERGSIKENIAIEDLFLSTRFMHPTVAGRTEWFKKWKYRDLYSGCEDYDLWIRSFKSSCFADMDECLLFYRDPLVFKLKTYLFRQQRLLECVWNLKNESQHGYYLFFRIILKSMVSSVAAIVLHILHADALFMKRRNKEIAHNIDYYNTYLKKFALNKDC